MRFKTGVSLFILSASLASSLACATELNAPGAAAFDAASLERRNTPFNRRVSDQIVFNQAALQLELGADFAGAWIDHDAHDRAYQIVAVTRAVGIRPALQTEGGTRQVIVRYSLQQLNDTKEALVRQYMKDGRSEPFLLSAGVDVPKNRVFVRVRPERMAELQAALRRERFDPESIRVEFQHGPSSLY